MKRILISAAVAALATAGLGTTPAAAQGRGPASFADIVTNLTPAVVNISTTQKAAGSQGGDGQLSRKFGGRAVSLGSGFIIDASGIVVTNNHVVDNAEEIVVTLSDRREYKARIRAVDTETDLAVLQLDAKGVRFPSVNFGDSTRTRIGDWVIAIGNPFGLGGSVTTGIVSARNRDIDPNSNFDDYIQTDAPINRGNSGGPLFDTAGRVIGINTAIYSQTGGSVGVGFAVPSEVATVVVDQLVKFGETRRGWLGVSIEEVTPKLAQELGFDRPKGAIVTAVRSNSPAAAAGLAEKDIVLDFNKRPINNARDLSRAVAETPVGSTAPMTIMRGGKRLVLQVRVDRRETRVSMAASGYLDNSGPLPAGAAKGVGMLLQRPTQDVIRAFGLPADVDGVVAHQTMTALDQLECGFAFS
ncbi:MAG: trypsin-like peptidase domain-containing protein, partial [Parvularculaceae bacterium]|nr:trypsin-like peptidase domain-containing protein [Parvularculaceae bacterium]